jgi:mRNA-degrading endonuclease RelE of RelBE toxin-antitoxin system
MVTMALTFDVGYDEQALEDLGGLRAFDRVRIMDDAEEQLANKPDVEEGRKKQLRLKNDTVIWQLTVGDFRVLYDVDDRRAEVTIRRVLKKGRLTTEEMMNQ